MKRIALWFNILVVLTTVVFFGCNKEDNVDLGKPVISLKKDAGYTFSSASAKYSDTLKIGISATSNGADNLIKFRLFANNQKQVDTTINSATFSLEFKFIKGTADKEVWKFEAIDKSNRITTDSLTITGNFGQINVYNSVKLGAQSNTTIPTFLSLNNSDTLRYFGAQAFANQQKIDIFLFFEAIATSINNMTLAGPASNITGIFSASIDPSKYTTKNLTRFSESTMTALEFDAIKNDAMILASFTAPEGKYKKSSLLKTGKVVPFKLQSGKNGLIKIINVTPAPDGSATGMIEFALKIQK